jgi:hypothetical protein
MARKLNNQRKPSKAPAPKGKRPPKRKRSDVNGFKGKRASVNIPWIMVEMIEQRYAECPYKSVSDYFLALALFDCWCRRHHRYTVTMMAQPPKVRDAAIAQIVEQFKNGETKTGDPGWFDRFIERIVREEILKAGGHPL